MSKTRLFIARHGETDYNINGLLQGRGINAPLNEIGRNQAERLAGYLKNYPTDKLISSSLERSFQTAQFVQQLNGLEIEQNPDLDEMHFGDFEGKPFGEVDHEIKRLDEAWRSGDVSLKIPGGESPLETFERADCAVRSYTEKIKQGTLTIVIHGRLIRILLSEWLGFGLKNMHKIEHNNGGVNQLVYENGKFEPIYLNKTDHLKEFNRV